MPRWERTIDVDAPASATWDLLGDPTSVPRWYPKYETADVVGGQRILRRADGGELVETLDARDDDARRLSYSVVSGAPVSSYHATFEVQEREGGSRVGKLSETTLCPSPITPWQVPHTISKRSFPWAKSSGVRGMGTWVRS